jgi:N-acylneuraminate cytidylyltransferase
MKCVSILPLRGGSKTIPKKNIKLIAGKPLAAWTLLAASGAKSINEVYVSTDCQDIALVAQQIESNVKVLSRPAQFATDEASTESVLLHFLSAVEFDVLVTIQATSPLLTSFDLDRAITQFHEQKLDSMLSAVRTKRFFWNDNATPINYDPLQRPRRQDFRGTMMENGAFYITKREVLERYKCRLGGMIGIYLMDETSAVEIDEPEDWERVEKLLLARQVSAIGG